MVEPQPSKRLRIHFIEKISAQVSPVFFAVKRSQHRKKTLSCQIRAKRVCIPSIPDGAAISRACTRNLLHIGKEKAMT
jgi:hypothetical protein